MSPSSLPGYASYLFSPEPAEVWRKLWTAEPAGVREIPIAAPPDRRPVPASVTVTRATLRAATRSTARRWNASNPYAGFRSQRSADDAMWLCRPGLPLDRCISSDLAATTLRPDGSHAVETREPVPRPAPILYTHTTLDPSLLGAHVLDFNFALAGCVALVEAKAAAAARAR